MAAAGPGLARPLASAAAAIVGYKGLFEYSSLGEALNDVARAAAAAIVVVSPAAPAVISAPSAETAALATLATVQALLNAQARTRFVGGLAALAVPAAIAAIVKTFGWNLCGWVTPAQLSSSLEDVKASVRAAVGGLSESIHARLDSLDASVASARAEVQELHSVVEARLCPLEEDARTSARGVELLCSLVASSGLLANASPDSLRQLDAFTHGGVAEAEEARRQPATARLEEAYVDSSAGSPSAVMGAVMGAAGFTAPLYMVGAR